MDNRKAEYHIFLTVQPTFYNVLKVRKHL